MPGINDLEFNKVDEPLRYVLKKFANLIDREWPPTVNQKGGTHIIFIHSFWSPKQPTELSFGSALRHLLSLEGIQSSSFQCLHLLAQFWTKYLPSVFFLKI